VQNPGKTIKTPKILERDLFSSRETSRSPKERTTVVYMSVNRRTWCSPWPPGNYRLLNKKAEFTVRLGSL